jgi:hypothetical protein
MPWHGKFYRRPLRALERKRVWQLPDRTPMRPARRSLPVLAAIALATALAACGGTTRLVYNGAEPAILLSAHRHVALEGDQWKLARAAIARFHDWHRRAELPRYAGLLGDAAARVRAGLRRADVEWAMESVRARYAALIDAAVREAMPVIETFDAENVATLERRFAQEDRKRERLAADPARLERERVKALVKRLEEWTGPLSEPQVGLVRQFVAATAEQPRLAHDLRLRRQRELVGMLDRAVQADSGPPAGALRTLFLDWGLERAPERRHRDEQFVQLVLGLDRSLSVEQRGRVVERLTGYAEDARALARGA